MGSGICDNALYYSGGGKRLKKVLTYVCIYSSSMEAGISISGGLLGPQVEFFQLLCLFTDFAALYLIDAFSTHQSDTAQFLARFLHFDILITFQKFYVDFMI